MSATAETPRVAAALEPLQSGGSLRRARRRDARLVPVAGAVWFTAALCVLNPGTSVVVAVALWSGAAAMLLCAVRSRGVRVGAVCTLAAVMFAASAGAATHVAAAQPARDAGSALRIDGGRALVLDATAVGKIERSADGWRFDAVLHRARLGAGDGPATEFPGSGIPILVRASGVPAALDLGAVVRLRGTAWRPDAGDRAVLVVDASYEVEVLAPPQGALAVASALRHGLLARSADLPPPGGGLIAGLAVGDTSAVTAELDADMKASSLSHLTAVSGANCALVVALAFGAAALCRARRAVRVAVGLGALVAFVVLVSPEPSVVRAAAMAAIAMLGVLLGRPGAGLSLLTAAVTVLLVLDPWLALSIGFALSTAATGALLVGAGPLADGLSRWMPRPLALGISVPLAAQLVCGPLIVLISPQLSVYGVVANMVAAPAAPVGTIAGLAACLTAGVPLLGAGLAALAWVPAAWIAGAAETFATLPGSVVDWPQGAGGLAALAMVGAAVAASIIPAPPRVRAVGVLVLAGALGAWLALGPVSDAMTRAAIPVDWGVAACDVGQGDAVVVRSAGQVALIDTGPDPAPLERCLGDLGVDRIDLLVLTHFDLDHRGGLAAVVGRVDIVLHGPIDGAAGTYALAELVEGGARLTPALRGMTGALGDAQWRVLWPVASVEAGNDASVVVDLRGGGVPTSLFLGDLSAEGQRAMSSGAALLSGYDVVKVAHHGSADQYPALYERLRAPVALVSVGENTYGHPRAQTLDLLTGLGARVARTDSEGLIVVRSGVAGLQIWRERSPAGVAAAG